MTQGGYYRVLGSLVNMVESHHVHMGATSAYKDGTLSSRLIFRTHPFGANVFLDFRGRVHMRQGGVHVRQGRVHAREGRVHVRRGGVHVRRGPVQGRVR